MTPDLMSGFAIMLLMYALGMWLGRRLALDFRDRKETHRDHELYDAAQMSRIVRDPQVTPIKDFALKYPKVMGPFMTQAQRVCSQGWAMWWVVEGVRDTLDRQVVMTQTIRDQLHAKYRKGDLIRYEDVDRLLAHMQTASEELQESLSDAQQNLEGNPESRVPQTA